MDQKELWSLVNLHFLEGRHMVLATGAVPLVMAGQRLLLAEARQAIVDVDLPVFPEVRAAADRGNLGRAQVDLVVFWILDWVEVHLGVVLPIDRQGELSAVLHQRK